MKIDKDNIQNWDKAAGKYSVFLQKGKNKYVNVYLSAIDELLDNVSGKRILDAGCGEGYYSRKLVLKKAIVTGIDGSKKMIAMAKSRNPEIKVDYKLMDLTQKLDFKNGHFDIVLASMVLISISKINVVIAEFARILKKNGCLIFSITHPCFFSSDWVLDEKGVKLYKPIFDYLYERVEKLNFWGKTSHYHRPLSYYFNILENNSFCVTSLKEPVFSDRLLKKRSGEESYKRTPLFIIIKAVVSTGKY
ncbi:MAG: class I SAM-dependent methyltransferase [Candidatus Omnitrophica bacterium]|nr:class I SAM-dependent methyltransferase [Candidatus Omnitrophota bacterium]